MSGNSQMEDLRYRAKAREQYAHDMCVEFDDQPGLRYTDDGQVMVQAWVYVDVDEDDDLQEELRHLMDDLDIEEVFDDSAGAPY